MQKQLIKSEAKFTFNSGFRYGMKKRCRYSHGTGHGLTPVDGCVSDHEVVVDKKAEEPKIARLKNGCLVNISSKT